jgi:predicted short-subunit dehydrogenase-like oxidoreductase (DUF2520 family)
VVDTDVRPIRTITVALIGAGNVGTALGVLLERAGHRVVSVAGSDRTRERARTYLSFTEFVPLPQAPDAARPVNLVVLAVPDDVIRSACSTLAEGHAFHRGQVVMHLAGSVDALETASILGADVLSVHPLQTVPTIEEGIARLPGSHMGVTAWNEHTSAFGEALAVAIGGRPFRLPDHVKPLYHAAAVFCSNYLVTVEAVAEELFRAAGLSDPLEMFEPLARAALDATLARGPSEALTGPAVRGDAGTISRNLVALQQRAPETIPAYVALAKMTARLALGSGRLPRDGYGRVMDILTRWS